jgi:hypothetical protein
MVFDGSTFRASWLDGTFRADLLDGTFRADLLAPVPRWRSDGPASAHTDGYNFVSIFDPAGGRNCSWAYSR